MHIDRKGPITTSPYETLKRLGHPYFVSDSSEAVTAGIRCSLWADW